MSTKYVLSTETVTKEEMTDREKSIFQHGYNEGIERGIEVGASKSMITSILIGFAVAFIISMALVF
jgi:hypothetical protein